MKSFGDQSPAVLLLGPRQCGKTTLARAVGGTYFDLEQEGDRLRLDVEWNRLMQGRERVILDEAQAWPEVFPRLRGAIDADRSRKNRFLLLGSVAPSMMTQVSDSLAGRLTRVRLDPLSLMEVKGEMHGASAYASLRRDRWGEGHGEEAIDRLWWRGGFPEPFLERSDLRWQSDYLRSLADRDLPEWGLSAKPSATWRLFHMVAALHGQNQNLSQLGKSMGLSYHTVGEYLDVLEGAYLIRRLPVYSANVKKRLVKSPKLYWCDSGLLHALLQPSSFDALWHEPWVGTSWEGYVIDQIERHLRSQGREFQLFFFRTSDQKEIDLVIKEGGLTTAVEIKLSSSISPGDLRKLNEAADLIQADQRVLVSRSPEVLKGDRVLCTNLSHFLESYS